MSLARRCSRTACGRQAVQTLTYVYADQTAVLGPLSIYAEPHAYDLCAEHSERLSAPRGWEVVRLVSHVEDPGPSEDDLLALADAVREAGRPALNPRARRPEALPESRAGSGPEPHRESGHETLRRGHLRVLSPDVPGAPEVDDPRS
ncbi:DUF3499 domain-containing protein [Nocardioides sp.]|uniref:DUF3499 domain-containing protein n=1 Tax=Nocardioides sp. TaxID=35761 RepID=UPI003514ABF0